MGRWNHNQVRRHMQVYAADGERVGHVAEVYEDSFLIHKGYVFPKDRYIPYSAISRVEENQIRLSLDSEQIQDALWLTRPDYESHEGDPTQLFYDREHGVADPFDDTGYERPMP